MNQEWSLDALYKGYEDPEFHRDMESVPARIEAFRQVVASLGKGTVKEDLIAQIHDMGGEVLMSTHLDDFYGEQQILDFAYAQRERGADFVKLVSKANTEGPFEKWYISCDYGTVNPTSMGLWGLQKGVWYRVKEFYFSSREKQRQMTDEEYAAEMKKLAGSRKITAVIADPSAASFIETLRRKGFAVQKADNDVLSGIRLTSDCLKEGRIVICEGCNDCLREMDAYIWDLSSEAKDRVKKENDHAMDDMRYFVSTVLKKQDLGFTAYAVERKT